MCQTQLPLLLTPLSLPFLLLLPLPHPLSTVSLQLSFLVVFNVVFVPPVRSGPRHPLLLRPPRRLGRFVLLEEINFNHNFSHRNCNSSMINDCSQHHTQLFQFQFLFLSNRNMILPERGPCQFFFPSLPEIIHFVVSVIH